MEFRGAEAKEEVLKLGGPEAITEKLKSHSSNGLDSDNVSDIEQRKKSYGCNYIEPKKPPTFMELCWEALQDVTLIILIFAAIFSILLPLIGKALSSSDEKIPLRYCLPDTPEEESHCDICEYLDGAAILFAVVLVVFITAYNDYKKEQKFRGLQESVEDNQVFTVIRSQLSIEVAIAELVVGDICQVKYGDSIPADGIVIQSNDLKVDESSLTGESDHVKKGVNRDPMLLSGTFVMEGSGKMIITAVGANSQSGIIFSLLQGDTGDAKPGTDAKVGPLPDDENPKPSPSVMSNSQMDAEQHNKSVLKAKLNKLAEQIGKIALICAVFTMIILYIRFTVKVLGGKDAIAAAIKDTQTECTDASEDNTYYTGYRYVYTGDDAPETCTSDSDVADCTDSGIAGCVNSTCTYTHGSTFIHDCTLVNETLFNVEGNLTGLLTGEFEKYDCVTPKLQACVRYFIIGVTILVVAVPEGLPLAVTIALAYSVSKMLLDNNLVRHLDACETMGNATAICSDKTGTLTTNRMTVVKSHMDNKTYEETPNESDIDPNLFNLMMTAISVNSSYTSKVIDGNQVGNKTECALLGFVQNLGRDYDSIRKIYPESSFFKVYTFNSARKSMSTVIATDDGHRLFTKGASEIVLGKCTTKLTDNGVVALSESDKDGMVEDVIEYFARQGLRTIGIAYKDVAGDVDWEDEDAIIGDLTLVGIVGIEDPVRPEVPDAIKQCKKAGIVVRMVTGDNINTARSIAYKCGILDDEDCVNNLVIEGREFNNRIRDDNGNIKQELIDQIWPKLRVLARSSPTDKHTLVKGIIDSKLTESREVVAVTGDGTNDGPALKIADVGFAMGIAGTDVAREASDIILTDDNFTSIVKAVIWGRNVYDSISKFLTFQLTVNVVAVMVSCIGAITSGESPFSAIQLLWVNLIMDTFAALALATELPTEALLDRKPYGRTKPLITRRMAKTVLGHSVYQLAVIFTLLNIPTLIPGNEDGKSAITKFDKTHLTTLFNSFVFMQIFNEINARKINDERNVFDRIFTNKIFLGVIVGTIITQVLLVQVPIWNIVFQCTALNLNQWLFCVGIGMFELIWGQVVITIPETIIPSFLQIGGAVPQDEDAVAVAGGGRRTTMTILSGSHDKSK